MSQVDVGQDRRGTAHNTEWWTVELVAKKKLEQERGQWRK